ncbi:MAG: NusG domain II-containing protein [Streptococcaceae bacterium]|nr:NusG domain II-containing protein [Streptococcaceae bacterium]
MKYIHLKKMDVFILILLFCFSFIPWGITAYNQSQHPAISYSAQLRVNGKIIKDFPLSKNTEYVYIEKDGDENVIEVKNNRIRIARANCPDQVCVRRGWISKGGETIVCLPHKLVLEVIASDGSQEGSVIY